MSLHVRVIIASTQQLFIDALAWRLEQEADVQVVGWARRETEALSLVASERPDVVVVEFRTERDLALLRRLSSTSSRTRTCVLTTTQDGRTLARAFAAGASAALAHTTSAEQLVAAIRHVVADECCMTPELVPTLLKALRQPLDGASGDGGEPGAALAQLTPRQREVLSLLVSGMDRAAIASTMHLSIHTVSTHVKHILAKLGVHSTLGAVSIGLQAGLRPGCASAGRQSGALAAGE